MATHRKINPKIGKHPDIFTPEAPTAVVVDDWRLLSPDELRRAAEAGELTDEDYEEMQGYEEQAEADGDIKTLLADGLSRKLAEAVAGEYPMPREPKEPGARGYAKTPKRKHTLRAELLDLDETSREKRAEPFINYVRDRMTGSLEMEFGNADGENVDESYYDAFQDDLESQHGDISTKDLLEAASDVSDHAKTIIEEEQLDEETLDEVLRDPGLYDIKRIDDEYRRVTGSVWSGGCGVKEDQTEGIKYDSDLNAILHGGEVDEHAWGPAKEAHERGEPTEGLTGRAVARTVVYPVLGDLDLQYALKKLDDEEPYVRITAWSNRGKPGSTHLDSGTKEGRAKFSVDDLDDGFDTSSYFYESSRLHAILDAEKLDKALDEKLEETGGVVKKHGPEDDDVAYRYAGTNDSVAGASGRGMYVAKMRKQKGDTSDSVKDLRRESTALGHCIGNKANGHPQAFWRGDTQVFSIRTEAGKSKFTIELKKDFASEPHGYVVEKSGAGPAGSDVIWKINEVYGKANRLPGFEAKNDKMSKPDDLRLVTDFLLHLGYSPETIRVQSQLKPGVTAMEEAGVSPFEPPPKKKRLPPRGPDPLKEGAAENPRFGNPAGVRWAAPNGGESYPVSARVAALLARAKPMGDFVPATRTNPLVGDVWDGDVGTYDTPKSTPAGLRINKRATVENKWRICGGCREHIPVGASFHFHKTAAKTTYGSGGSITRCAACCNDGKGRTIRRADDGRPLRNPAVGFDRPYSPLTPRRRR